MESYNWLMRHTKALIAAAIAALLLVASIISNAVNVIELPENADKLRRHAAPMFEWLAPFVGPRDWLLLGAVILLIAYGFDAHGRALRAYRARLPQNGAQAPKTDGLPIAIARIAAFGCRNYAGFFEKPNPRDSLLVDFMEVTITNISTDRRVALDLLLKVRADNFAMDAAPNQLSPLLLSYGKDDQAAKMLTARGVETLPYYRNPIELGPQEMARKHLVFLFFPFDDDHRNQIAKLIPDMPNRTLTLEVMDHISGKRISFTIPGEYRGSP